MNRSERKELYKCSNKGLLQLLQNPALKEDKKRQFNAMISYIARHGIDNKLTKGELLDLVYSARDELLAQAAEKHATSKEPFPWDDMGNLEKTDKARVKDFIRDPVTAIVRELTAYSRQRIAARKEDDPDQIDFAHRSITNAGILATMINIESNSLHMRHHKSELVDVMNRLNKKYEDSSLTPNEVLNKANSGVFGTLFRRPSKQFTQFKEAFEEFSDPSRAYSGQVDQLEKKTTAYLVHLNKDFKYEKGMNKEQFLNCLPKGQRGRASFALNVLDSIHEHKEIKPYLDNVENAIKGKPVDQNLGPIDNAPKQVDQMQFQKDLELNVEEPKVEAPQIEEEVKDNNLIVANDLRA